VFNQAVSTSLFPDKLSLVFAPKNAFSMFLFEYAVRIRMSQYSKKGKEQEMFAVSKQLLKLSI
jgi:hypothetical protein